MSRIYSFHTIIEADENGTYHGYAPLLKGCHTWGSTVEETNNNLREAIELTVRSLIDDGEQVPTEGAFPLFQTITLSTESVHA